MAMTHIPTDIPKNLHHLAAKLSWQDAAHLLCLYEGWSQKEDGAEVRARCGRLAENMRVLVNGLPFDWTPPNIDEHDIVTWLAAHSQGKPTPKAPPRKREPEELKVSHPTAYDITFENHIRIGDEMRDAEVD